jgi:hypothetical protein
MFILFKVFYKNNSNQGLDYKKEFMGYIIFLCLFFKLDLGVI